MATHFYFEKEDFLSVLRSNVDGERGIDAEHMTLDYADHGDHLFSDFYNTSPEVIAVVGMFAMCRLLQEPGLSAKLEQVIKWHMRDDNKGERRILFTFNAKDGDVSIGWMRWHEPSQKWIHDMVGSCHRGPDGEWTGHP